MRIRLIPVLLVVLFVKIFVPAAGVLSAQLLPHRVSEPYLATLAGLSELGVYVAVDAVAEEAGYGRYQAQTDVILRLQENGIRVLDDDQTLETPGVPNLFVSVLAADSGVQTLLEYENAPDLLIFSLTAEFSQKVSMGRMPSITLLQAPTWSVGFFGLVKRGGFS